MPSNFKKAEIVAIDTALPAARVKILDADGVITDFLQFIFPNCTSTKDYDLPEIGARVLCLFSDTGLEEGFILGGFYNINNTPPANSADKFVKYFKDGSKIEYDRASHKLAATIAGSAEITATVKIEASAPQINITGSATVKISAPVVTIESPSVAIIPATGAGEISVKGDISIEGKVTATNDVLAGVISLKNHTHNVQGVESGTSTITTTGAQ